MHTNKKRLPGGSLFRRIGSAVTEQARKQTANVIAKGMQVKYGAHDNMEVTDTNLRKIARLYLDLLSKTKWDHTGQARTRFEVDFMSDMHKEADTFSRGEFTIPGGGKTAQDLHDFYWRCSEFVKLWTEIGQTSEDLLGLIKNYVS